MLSNFEAEIAWILKQPEAEPKKMELLMCMYVPEGKSLFEIAYEISV